MSAATTAMQTLLHGVWMVSWHIRQVTLWVEQQRYSSHQQCACCVSGMTDTHSYRPADQWQLIPIEYQG